MLGLCVDPDPGKQPGEWIVPLADRISAELCGTGLLEGGWFGVTFFFLTFSVLFIFNAYLNCFN